MRRRRLHVPLVAVIAVVVVAMVVALKVTGHPPKHCTWRYTSLGKGAYSAECVPNDGRPRPR